MSGHPIDFVALDRARKDHRGPALDDPWPQWLDPRLNCASVQVEFLGHRKARQVQPPEREADDPGRQGLRRASADRSGQVLEPLATSLAERALPLGWGVVLALLEDRHRAAVGAGKALGPTPRRNGLKALGVVDEVADVDPQSIPRCGRRRPSLVGTQSARRVVLERLRCSPRVTTPKPGMSLNK